MKRFTFVAMMLMSVCLVAEEKVAFLGVGTRPLTVEEAEGVEVPRGVGLKVDEVVPEAPAEGVLEFDDILVRLGDQWLIHPDQFAVLVRMRAPGESVRLEVLRGGERRVVDLTLGERVVAPVVAVEESLPEHEPGLGGGGDFFPDNAGGVRGQIPAEILMMMQQRRLQEGMEGGGEFRVDAVRATRRMQFVENGMSVTTEETDGKKEVTVVENGKEVFKGPVNTPEERAKVPGPLRQRLRARGILPEDAENTP